MPLTGRAVDFLAHCHTSRSTFEGSARDYRTIVEPVCPRYKYFFPAGLLRVKHKNLSSIFLLRHYKTSSNRSLRGPTTANMHFLTFPALVLASTAALVGAASSDGPPYIGCGAEGYSDANTAGPSTLPLLLPSSPSTPVPANRAADCRAAVAKIDVNDPLVTAPEDTIESIVAHPFVTYRVIAKSGNCKIAAIDRMDPVSGGGTTGTAFSGKKTVKYANVSCSSTSPSRCKSHGLRNKRVNLTVRCAAGGHQWLSCREWEGQRLCRRPDAGNCCGVGFLGDE